jgi:hypothetical protein
MLTQPQILRVRPHPDPRDTSHETARSLAPAALGASGLLAPFAANAGADVFAPMPPATSRSTNAALSADTPTAFASFFTVPATFTTPADFARSPDFRPSNFRMTSPTRACEPTAYYRRSGGNGAISRRLGVSASRRPILTTDQKSQAKTAGAAKKCSGNVWSGMPRPLPLARNIPLSHQKEFRSGPNSKDGLVGSRSQFDHPYSYSDQTIYRET